MKKLILVIAALSLFAAAAQAEYNEIGLYTTADANPANTSYNGAPGTLNVYVVLTDPRNFHTGSPDSNVESDMNGVGGFEFRVVLPAGVYLLNSLYPAGSNTTNFLTPPNYLAGCNIPVVNGMCTLVTLNLGAFAPVPGFLYLAPVTPSNVQSIENSMAITDYFDDFRLNPAFPVSGDFANPVFGLWTAVVESQDASWGELHSLFR